MLCGYRSPFYDASLERWRRIDHEVPTRGGLQSECLWMNFARPSDLHDSRFVGDDRRERERIRRRQQTVAAMLTGMNDRERQAMVEFVNTTFESLAQSRTEEFLEESRSQRGHG